ncbi:MAG: CBS domain-containing protein [Thermodesulfobacteriota bacterium]
MLVRDIMDTDPGRVQADSPLSEVVSLFKEKGKRIVLVERKGKLAGVVGHRDLGRAAPRGASAFSVGDVFYAADHARAADVMTRDPVCVHYAYTVEEAARVIMETDVPAAPVRDNTPRAVGVIDRRELFKTLIALTGVNRGGIQIAFCPDDRPGSIKQIADLVRRYGGRMISILTKEAAGRENRREVYMRMHSLDRRRLSRMKQELAALVTLRYIVDYDENQRELFDEEKKPPEK